MSVSDLHIPPTADVHPTGHALQRSGIEAVSECDMEGATPAPGTRHLTRLKIFPPDDSHAKTCFGSTGTIIAPSRACRERSHAVEKSA